MAISNYKSEILFVYWLENQKNIQSGSHALSLALLPIVLQRNSFSGFEFITKLLSFWIV